MQQKTLSILKKLAGQTAIYGLSSIVARFLNYLLVPLHTVVFVPQQYGVITEMYAYVAFLIILLTYGMETAFFRFSTKDEHEPKTVFSTILSSLASSTGVFILMAILFAQPIADWLLYPDNKEYVVWFAIIVGLDAVSSIPLARLRSENKAKTFAGINIANVLVNIGLNVFFLRYCLPLVAEGGGNWLTDTFYDTGTGVGYVFIANLIASIVKFLLLGPTMLRGFTKPQWSLLKPMLIYSLPLLVAGLAGMMNEMFDRVMLKRILYPILGQDGAMYQLGVYGACYKLSIVISLMIQAFRYAAEPFFFSQEKEAGSKQLYAKIMTYFVWILAGTFLFVMLYIDLFKYFIPNEDYWVGLKVVPILLMANIFLGIYYNQSVWYKLTEKTAHGAGLAIFGAIITIVINLLFIPTYGYMASAWATFACYGSMMVVSYLLGRKYYPVPYELGKLFGMVGGAVLLYWASVVLHVSEMQYGLALNVLFLLTYAGLSWFLLRPNFK
ncbi:MAG: oligosaccharide flippase family protein [Flavobacteriales bacterium]|jgi:O-antigen/teichoic acid export membrane protein|nr:oligosaccharide flippase family protein [Flavobacteriales bacterium]